MSWGFPCSPTLLCFSLRAQLSGKATMSPTEVKLLPVWGCSQVLLLAKNQATRGRIQSVGPFSPYQLPQAGNSGDESAPGQCTKKWSAAHSSEMALSPQANPSRKIEGTVISSPQKLVLKKMSPNTLLSHFLKKIYHNVRVPNLITVKAKLQNCRDKARTMMSETFQSVTGVTRSCSGHIWRWVHRLMAHAMSICPNLTSHTGKWMPREDHQGHTAHTRESRGQETVGQVISSRAHQGPWGTECLPGDPHGLKELCVLQVNLVLWLTWHCAQEGDRTMRSRAVVLSSQLWRGNPWFSSQPL